MIVWTIQPLSALEQISAKGAYHCDSDFGALQAVMLDSYVANAKTEEEYIRLEKWLDELSDVRMGEEIQKS